MSRPFIALVGLSETFSVETHSRNDLTALSLTIRQSEGELAVASIEIPNPRTPLSALENRRVLISERKRLIFDGLVQTVPRGAVDATVSIDAVATSADLPSQLKALAQTQKVAPAYDALFVPQGSEDDLAEILAGTSKVVAHSRIKGTPSAVDALGGSSTVEIRPLDGSVSFDFEGKVPRRFGIELEVSWTQLVRQQFFLNSEFSDVSTMTPGEIIAAWPQKNATIGSDFRVSYSKAALASGFRASSGKKKLVREDAVSPSELDPAFIEEGKETVTAEIQPLDLALTLDYTAEVRRKETCAFSFPIALVESAYSDEETEVETVRLRDFADFANIARWSSERQYAVGDQVLDGSEIFECITAHRSFASRTPAYWKSLGTSPYITSRRVASFFGSTRGKAALAHAAERVKARALIAARSVRVSFEAPLRKPELITHDCAVRLLGSRIPGGAVEGRLVEYTLTWAAGRRSMNGTIACCAGTGGASNAVLSPGVNRPPVASGRVDVSISGTGKEQEAAFVAGNDIPITQISISTVPVPQTDFEHTFPVIASGSIRTKSQVSV